MTKDKLSEKGSDKKKENLSVLEMYEDFLKENNPDPNEKFKSYQSRYVCSKRNKLLSLDYMMKKDKNVKLGPTSPTKSNRHPNQDEIVLSTQSPSAGRSDIFPPESKPNQNNPRRDTTRGAFLEFYQWEQGGGFPNLGNTCYMNAVLQSLFAIPSFAEDLLTQDVPWMKIPLNALIKPLSQLLLWKDIFKVETKGELLLSIKKAISAVSDIFSGNLQNDAHEFLGQCLDQLKKDIKDLNRSIERETEHKNSPTPTQPDGAAVGVSLCPVVANFEFELQISITCTACGQMTHKTESSNYLSINLHQGDRLLPPSVQSLLNLYFKTEDVEHTCKECESKNAMLQCRFSQLPRVLIVHLKRYSMDERWQPVKNSQQVGIPGHLCLAPHCKENPQPPPRHRPMVDDQVLEVFQDWTSENLGLPTPSVMLSSASQPLAVPGRPEEYAEQQRAQIAGQEGLRHELEQSSLGNGSALELQLGNSGSMVQDGERLPAPASTVGEGDVSLCMIHEDEKMTVSVPHSHLGDMHPPQVPENPELSPEETAMLTAALNLLEGFYDHIQMETLERGQRTTGWFHQNDQKRMEEELLHQVASLSAGKLDSLEKTEKDLSGSSELRPQKTDPISLGAPGSSKAPENKDIWESESSTVEAGDPTLEQTGDPLGAYRLISVVSHLGSSQESGHYISDVYDFEKQAWFTYNDLQVFRIPEAVVKKARRHCGYIFFYMHHKLFEALVGRQQTPS
ncbi:ubiquitin carboxyl-terminal hydrolase 29-like [Perognathus longimembris pacificus]|uniref:ubiquitin carboxyl-terminal hydrolase 29-like n=1 Tax=Perognathus longimembris pacificus TaxID=214514 RepID=UPI0020186014|nr:ubiquitin carboxyl-terminal hydrolase 29-like [Perognathus longimembris pacificus]